MHSVKNVPEVSQAHYRESAKLNELAGEACWKRRIEVIFYVQNSRQVGLHLLRCDVKHVRHVQRRKESKAYEEIKGGHLANELVRSLREWEWDCGECSLTSKKKKKRERKLWDYNILVC